MTSYLEGRVKKARARKSKGFTLLEMMIVVAIIGIIAGIIALNYAHSKSNAQLSASEADLHQIATALELYYSDNQAYPGTAGSQTSVTQTLFGGAANKYLNTQPNAPGSTGGPYTYTLDSTGNDYTITDPDTYDTQSLGNLPYASTSPTGGDVTVGTSKCGATNCSHVGYSNEVGQFGY